MNEANRSATALRQRDRVAGADKWSGNKALTPDQHRCSTRVQAPHPALTHRTPFHARDTTHRHRNTRHHRAYSAMGQCCSAADTCRFARAVVLRSERVRGRT